MKTWLKLGSSLWCLSVLLTLVAFNHAVRAFEGNMTAHATTPVKSSSVPKFLIERNSQHFHAVQDGRSAVATRIRNYPIANSAHSFDGLVDFMETNCASCGSSAGKVRRPCNDGRPLAPAKSVEYRADGCEGSYSIYDDLSFEGAHKIIDPETIASSGPGEHLPVLVLLSGYEELVGVPRAGDAVSLARFQADIRARRDIVLERLDPREVVVRHRYDNILAFSARATRVGIRALAAMDEVAVIESDQVVYPHLAQGIPLINASAARSAYDGAGVSIAIVDTGIDYAHTRLGGGGFPNAKVIGGYDFGDGDNDPKDCQGHGTAVAGIAAGDLAIGPGDYIGGVAPNARLYALKIVSGCQGSSSSGIIAAAWDWVVTHQYDDPGNPILVINTSFGGGYHRSSCDSVQRTLAIAASNAVANGIAVLASSGNDGYCDGMGSPACVSDAISVGAVYDARIGAPGWCVSTNSCIGIPEPRCSSGYACWEAATAADQVTCYSNSSSFLDILASSNDAYTTAVGGGYTSTFGGTSAAAPYAAGAAAVLQSHALSERGTSDSVATLKRALVTTGASISDSKSAIITPRVDVGEALEGGGGEDNWPTAYRQLLGGDDDLALLRRYRDEYLVQTPSGRYWTKLLYASSDEALSVLLANPDLMQRAKQLIGENLVAVQAVIEGRAGVISNADEVAAFLADYAAQAPLAQRALAKLVRRDLLQGGDGFFGFAME